MEEFLEIGTFFELSNEKHYSQLTSVLVITYFCHKFSFYQEKNWHVKFLKLFDLPNYNQVREQVDSLYAEDRKYYLKVLKFYLI